MIADSQNSIKNHPGVELKADSFTLLKLCTLDLDSDAIDALLFDRVAKAPEFFRNSPIVLDLSGSNEEVVQGNLAVAIGAIRGYGLIPVGVRGGPKKIQEQAKLLELATFPESSRTTSKTKKVQSEDASSNLSPGKVVDTPVRSGQRIYAQGGDLILLAPVSSGAEVVADGHVHAYAPIRGRVLAGVKGNASACIFCKDLKAELVSIAGRYKVSEDLTQNNQGHPVLVSLSGDTMVFKGL